MITKDTTHAEKTTFSPSSSKENSPINKKYFKFIIVLVVIVIVVVGGMNINTNIIKNYLTISDRSFQEGQSYIDNGNYDKAIEIFNQVLKLKPDSYNAYIKLGLIYYKTKDYNKAEENLKKALGYKIDSSNKAIAYSGLTAIYFERRDYPKVIENGNKAIELQKSLKSTIYPQIATAYLYLKNEIRAQEFFSKGLESLNEKGPAPRVFNNGGLNASKAMLYKGLGEYNIDYPNDYNKAIEYFQKVLELPIGNYNETYFDMGEAYTFLGKYNEAIEYFNKITNSSSLGGSNFAMQEVYNLKGRSYYELGDYDLAIDNFNKAIKLKEDNKGKIESTTDLENTVSSYYGLGKSHLKKGSTEIALENFNKGLSILSDFRTVLVNKNSNLNLYSLLLRYEAAKIYYEKAENPRAKELIDVASQMTQIIPASASAAINKMQWPKEETSIFERIRLLKEKILQ